MGMSAENYKAALKEYPCPSCGEKGDLEEAELSVKLDYKDNMIEAKGEGTVCQACGHHFMSDELTESIANQVQRIDDGGARRYLEVNRSTGELKGHTLN